MTNIFDYLKSLLPRFGKDKVSELSRQTQSELNTHVIPSFIESEKGLGRKTFRSKKIQDLTKTLHLNLKTDKNDNIVTVIRKKLEQISKNTRVIENQITDTFEDEIVVAGITVLKVNILRFLEIASFVSRYSTKFLNYIYILEITEIGGDPKKLFASLSEGEISWLEARYLDYCIALSILARDGNEILGTIKNLPQVEIGEDPSSVSAVFGQTKVDPFGFNRLSGFTNNPIMHIRLLVANYQSKKYQEQKELKKLLTLRLEDLKRQQENNPDARLQQQIDYTQARVDNLSAEINEAEQSVM